MHNKINRKITQLGNEDDFFIKQLESKENLKQVAEYLENNNKILAECI